MTAEADDLPYLMEELVFQFRRQPTAVIQTVTEYR